MSKKYMVAIICILLTTTLIIGCSNDQPIDTNSHGDKTIDGQLQKNDEKKLEQNIDTIDQLASLLPDDIGFIWSYSGFAEYAHNMELLDIDKKDDVYTYTINGSVEDLSGGESEQDLSIEITYIIKPGFLIQNINSMSMLDSNFPCIQLITTPFNKGNSWQQEVEDTDGNKTILECSIQDIKTIGGKKEYTILYEDTQSEYYEKRIIREGIGVISFEKLLNLEGEEFIVGYSFFEHPDDNNQEFSIDLFIPPVNNTIIYTGIAEYAHKGEFAKLSGDREIYEFNGVLSDGSDAQGNFKVQYEFNHADQTIIENVISNTRSNKPRVNSLINGLILLKGPIEQDNTWSQDIQIDGQDYTITSKIIYCDDNLGSVTVKYVIEGIDGYYNNTYIEERTFVKGLGMTSFSCLMPGDIGVQENSSPEEIEEALANNMFGYSINLDYQ
ncbi:MAG: hypothetical protein PHP06_02890 [Clostridia bacterium]|nr:hypothetical protein [Clostridia bacterium]